MQALGDPAGELEGDRAPDGFPDAEVQEAVGVGGVSPAISA